MKFDMGTETLTTLSQKTSTESDDLRSLVNTFIRAADPLQHKLAGPAKDAFDKFKAKSDEVADTLNTALVGICGSIDGQSQSFIQGAQEGADTHRTNEGSANFAGVEAIGRFGPR
ncbi:WXG100 family type VII secretion target [Micropruina sp.]|uniref:WXG100 family type VII secretion target n=1 Tax=Micropruina sp. TaxID=2737536 RepID=UPI0039E52595